MNLDSLIELAEKATLGPWQVGLTSKLHGISYLHDSNGDPMGELGYRPDAEYIGSLSPSVLLPLLRAVREVVAKEPTYKWFHRTTGCVFCNQNLSIASHSKDCPWLQLKELTQ